MMMDGQTLENPAKRAALTSKSSQTGSSLGLAVTPAGFFRNEAAFFAMGLVPAGFFRMAFLG